mmetsp:Transcript_10317/g.14152  ORF Transcript_10317/g.14152 Transcript_10317/m.14152 type:complete len:209 (-) Transcript_10317:501-1127(-)
MNNFKQTIINQQDGTIKYSVKVQNVEIVFSTSSSIDLQYLPKFCLKELPTDPMNEIDDAELLNTKFNDFMDAVIPLLRKYEATYKRQRTEQPLQTQTQRNEYPQRTQNQPQYVFRVPSTARETVFDKHWKDHFNELQEFKKSFGHCNVSRTTKGYDQLGNWLSDQRKKLRRGKLTREQYEMLTELGVEWDRSSQFTSNHFRHPTSNPS